MDILSLSPAMIERAIQEILYKGHRSIIVTLVNGDILFGDLWYFRDSDGTFKSFGNDLKTMLPLQLIYNSPNGRVYGDSHFIGVPSNLISGLRPLAWTKDSRSQLPLQRIPNPMATLIANHNQQVAQKYALQIREYMEKALVEDAIPPDGIRFDDDEIIYADWEYLARNIGKSLAIGIRLIGLSAQLSGEKGLDAVARNKLKSGNVERLRLWLKRNNTTSGEHRFVGYIVPPEKEQTTEIEGKECLVMLCVEQKDGTFEKGFLPVILKKESISYAPEFFPMIASPVVFWGEIKQIPITVGVFKSQKALLARVIGYVKGTDDLIK